MIKNIYDKENKNYKHKYYCDCCYMEISEFGEICRNQKAMKFDLFDLCNRCEYLMKEKKMINKCVICKSEAPFNLSYCYDCVNFKVIKCAMCDLVVPRDHAHYIEGVENYYCKKCFKKYC